MFKIFDLLKKIPRGPVVVSISAVLAGLIWWFMRGANISVLNPKGRIAQEQYELMVFATLLMTGIVIAVFSMTFYIVWKYRASNTKAKYQPDWDRNNLAEAIWWLIPLVIIVILSVVIWRSSHDLDPYKKLEADKKPLTVEVIALNWKWLFIYPEQHIASVNYLQVPVNTPINFKLTSDATMNSFWIPQLGGQVYAMAGMETKLHLEADEAGEYQGSSANISGEGFSGMKFTTKATSRADFDNWISRTASLSNALTPPAYGELAKPSRDNPVALYGNVEKNLYDTVIMKYMMPKSDADTQKQPVDSSQPMPANHDHSRMQHDEIHMENQW